MAKKRRKARKKRKQSREIAKKFFTVVVIIIVIAAAIIMINERYIHCEYIPTTDEIISFIGLEDNPEVMVEQDEIAVHFIDVGQGDCIFIDTADKDMLIDCGEYEYASRVIRYLHNNGVTKLDYIITTHPHSDHMGGMARIMTAFDVGEFIMPEVPEDMIPIAEYYTKTMNTLGLKGITTTYSEAGRTITLCEGTQLNIIGPIGDSYDDLNSYSIIAKLTSGNRSFLFTGDMEKDAEFELVNTWIDLSADVIKIPHHGSSSSSSSAFVKRVRPSYAVVSVGEGNTYGHPNSEVLNRYRLIGSKVISTMNSGSVVFVTDGNEITYITSEQENAA